MKADGRERRDLHLRIVDGMVACNPRDKEGRPPRPCGGHRHGSLERGDLLRVPEGGPTDDAPTEVTPL